MFGRSHYGWVECVVIDIETSIIFLLHKFHLNFQFCSKREKSNFKVNLYACDTRCVWVCSSCRECASNQHLTKINWKLQIFNRFPKLTSSKFFFSNGIRCASFPSIIHLSMARSIYYVDLYFFSNSQRCLWISCGNYFYIFFNKCPLNVWFTLIWVLFLFGNNRTCIYMVTINAKHH